MRLEKELQNSQTLIASNFLTQEQPDKSLEVLRNDLLKRNWLCVWCSLYTGHSTSFGRFEPESSSYENIVIASDDAGHLSIEVKASTMGNGQHSLVSLFSQ